MTAKNGWSGSARRALGLCLALVLVGSAVFASTASAKKAPPTPATYLALGDSISYGYSQQKFEENFPTESPSAFEGGFVNLLGAKLAKKVKSTFTLTTENLSCPGENSDGLIGLNEALGGNQKGNGVNDSAPCAWHNVDGFPRHTEYGTASQLEAAAAGAKEAQFVTLQIGSNDELAVVAACNNSAYLTLHGFKGTIECLLHEVGKEGFYYEGGAFFHIIHNIGDVVGVLRASGFTGEVGVLGFYNPQAEILPGSDTLQAALNKELGNAIKGKAFGEGVYFANPFPKTNPSKGGKAEEKAICKYTEECNVHDKKVNEEKELAEKGEPKEVTTAEAEKYPKGDIHPTTAGHELFTKLLYKALIKKESVE